MFFGSSPTPSPTSTIEMMSNEVIYDTYIGPTYEYVMENGPNIWFNQEGLDVYEEIHQNMYNRMVHVIFLPGVFYGVFRAFPALNIFPFNRLPPFVSILSILMMYIIYYGSFDLEGSFYAFLFNLPSATLAYCHLQQFTRESSVRMGLSTMVFSLSIQELVGHLYLEETASRLTVSYVLNAIMYAPLFHAKDLLLNLSPMLMNTATIMFFTLFLYLLNI
jgi:uncharacterized membrane protein YGL010W